MVTDPTNPQSAVWQLRHILGRDQLVSVDLIDGQLQAVAQQPASPGLIPGIARCTHGCDDLAIGHSIELLTVEVGRARPLAFTCWY